MGYLLKEYAGVSQDVWDVACDVMKKIIQTARTSEWNYIGQMDFSLRQDFGKISYIQVHLVGYNPEVMSFEEYYKMLDNNNLINNSYSPTTHKLSLEFPYPFDKRLNGEVMSSIRATINHELLHALQYINKTPNSQQYYNLKNDSAKGVYPELLREIYYFFSQTEMGAFIQEVWVEAQSLDNFKDSPTYKRFVDNFDTYQLLKRAYKIPELRKEMDEYLNKFRMNSEMFFKKMDKQVNKAKSKLIRLEYRWKQENENNKEGNFKNYSQNEIPMQYNFNQEPKSKKLKRYLSRIFK